MHDVLVGCSGKLIAYQIRGGEASTGGRFKYQDTCRVRTKIEEKMCGAMMDDIVVDHSGKMTTYKIEDRHQHISAKVLGKLLARARSECPMFYAFRFSNKFYLPNSVHQVETFFHCFWGMFSHSAGVVNNSASHQGEKSVGKDVGWKNGFTGLPGLKNERAQNSSTVLALEEELDGLLESRTRGQRSSKQIQPSDWTRAASEHANYVNRRLRFTPDPDLRNHPDLGSTAQFLLSRIRSSPRPSTTPQRRAEPERPVLQSIEESEFPSQLTISSNFRERRATTESQDDDDDNVCVRDREDSILRQFAEEQVHTRSRDATPSPTGTQRELMVDTSSLSSFRDVQHHYCVGTLGNSPTLKLMVDFQKYRNGSEIVDRYWAEFSRFEDDSKQRGVDSRWK